MNRFLSVCSLLGFGATAAAAEPIVDVPKLAGQSKAAVAAELGPPSVCEMNKYGEKCRYEKKGVEILFVNKRADWITVHAVADRPYSPEILETLGFKPKPPDFNNQFTIRWENLAGFLSVSVFPRSGGKIDYAYIKVTTP